MASNAPTGTSPARHDLFGLPLWAWGLGLGAFLLAVVLFFRQQSNTGSSQQTASTSGAIGVPVPFPVGTSTGTQSSSCNTPDTPIKTQDWSLWYGTWEYKPNGQYGQFVQNCVVYSHIDDPAQASAIQDSGGNVFYFPAPGVPAVFPIKWFRASLWSGTTIVGTQSQQVASALNLPATMPNNQPPITAQTAQMMPTSDALSAMTISQSPVGVYGPPRP